MKLFIFDMGNVFLRGIAIIREMAESLGIDESSLRSDYSLHEGRLMDGSMQPDEYYSHLEERYGIQVKGDPFLDFFHPVADEDILRLCDDLRRNGNRVVVGSNTFAPHWAYVWKMPSRPLMHFDALYASHLIHIAKPEPEFWQFICRSEHSAPEETVFIDDLEENCNAASSIGINTFLYKGDGRYARLESFIGAL